MKMRGKFRLVLCDPPWAFRTYSDKGKKKSPERHYSCMTPEEIFSLGEYLEPVVAQDSILLLWVTNPHLPNGIRCGEAWGFSYRTVAFVWAKPRIGCGYYTRAGAEQCLLFRRGKGLPVVNRGVRQVILAPTSRHSEKPEESYSRIETLFGEVPRLELFARKSRSRWVTLGNEIDGRDIRESLETLARESESLAEYPTAGNGEYDEGNLFDALAEHAVEEYRAGRTRSIEAFARDMKIPLESE